MDQVKVTNSPCRLMSLSLSNGWETRLPLLLEILACAPSGQGPPGDAGRAHGEAACSAAEVAGQMRRGRVCRTRGRGLSSVLLLPEPILKAWVSYLQNPNCGQPALKHVSAL